MTGTNFVARAGTLPSFLWGRVKSSKFTALYITFIVAYSIMQIGLRARIYAIDGAAYDSLDTSLAAGRASSSRIPVLDGSSIKLCDSYPSGPNDYGMCSTVYDANDGSVHILVRDDPSVLADQTCLEALNYPVYVLRSDLREDAVSLAIQLFSMAVGVTAIAQQHVSHFVTGNIVQVIAVAWAAVRVRDTGVSGSDFDRVITNGACGGQVLSNFWSNRWGLDIAVLAMDILGLILSLVFSYKTAQFAGLTNVSSTQVSSTTKHVYKVMVTGLVAIELSMFFSLASGALWVEQMFFLNGITGLGMVTRVMYTLVEVVYLPILLMGWVALHREMWKTTLVFLGLSFVFVVGWGLTFILETFRITVRSWTLFGFLVVFSGILAVTVFVCTIVSACFFGKGMILIGQGNNQSSSSDVHVISSLHSRAGSESSIEKGEYSVKELHIDSVEKPAPRAPAVPHAPRVPTVPQAPRVAKHKATALARGLCVTPPPP